MKATNWKHANITLGRGNDIKSIPALKIRGEEGHTITRWKFNIFERIKILFGAKLYIDILTFNQSFHPIKMSTRRKKIYIFSNENKISFISKIRLIILAMVLMFGTIAWITGFHAILSVYIPLLFILIATRNYEKNKTN